MERLVNVCGCVMLLWIFLQIKENYSFLTVLDVYVIVFTA